MADQEDAQPQLSIINLKLRKPDTFDRLVHEGMPCGDELTMATKDDCTSMGNPCVVLSFDAQTPSGEIVPAQFVVTVRNLKTAMSAILAAHNMGRIR